MNTLQANQKLEDAIRTIVTGLPTFTEDELFRLLEMAEAHSDETFCVAGKYIAAEYLRRIADGRIACSPQEIVELSLAAAEVVKS